MSQFSICPRYCPVWWKLFRLERIPEAWLVFPEDGHSPAIPVNLRNAIGSRLQVRAQTLLPIITISTVFLYVFITTFDGMLVLGVVVLLAPIFIYYLLMFGLEPQKFNMKLDMTLHSYIVLITLIFHCLHSRNSIQHSIFELYVWSCDVSRKVSQA